MWNVTVAAMWRVMVGVAVLLIGKVTLSVVAGYGGYFPPDFGSDFLMGREAYFFGPYRWAFYTHVVAGPVSLVLGTILVSEWFRVRFSRWHRRLGKTQIACVLLLVAPSGLWMAGYAATGMLAGAGLGLLAVATAACAGLGWRAAMARRFDEHRRWMWRMYLLLCSAVVIRVMGGLATVLGVDAEWVYPASVWGSWVGPLVVFELWRKRQEGIEQEATEGTEEGREKPRRTRMTRMERGRRGERVKVGDEQCSGRSEASSAGAAASR